MKPETFLSAVLLVVSAFPAMPQQPATIRTTGVAVLDASDAAYRDLQAPAGPRVHPEEPRRLVVFRDGALVADYGLRHEVQRISGAAGGEEELLEETEVAADGAAAVVVLWRFRTAAAEAAPLPADPGRGLDRRNEGVEVVEVRLTWVDPQHPEGRWSYTLEPGRWLQRALVLPEAKGVALSTSREPAGPADFRLLGADGVERVRRSELRGSVVALDATYNGAFLAVDLAFPSGEGLPDRGVMVLDLNRGTSWTYAWRYGGEMEPVDYELRESGVLEVRLPGRSCTYDRFGGLIRCVKNR